MEEPPRLKQTSEIAAQPSPLRATIEKRRIGIALIAAFSAEMVNKIAPLITLHLAQARLGTSGFGEVQFCLLFMESVIPFIAFGYGTLAALEVASVQNDRPKMGRIITSVLALRAIHLLLAGGWLLTFLYKPSHAEDWGIFLAASLLLLAASLETDFAHYGTQTVSTRNLFGVAAKLVGVTMVAVAVRTPSDKAIYAAAAAAPPFLLALASFRYNVRGIVWAFPSRKDLLQLFLRSIPYAMIVWLVTFADRFDALLVERLFGLHATGIYAGQQRLVQSIASAASAIGVVFFSEMIASKDKESFTAHAGLSLWAMASIVAPIAGGVWFVDRAILSLMYNSEFALHPRVLDFLTLGSLLQVLVQVFGLQILLVKRRLKTFITGMTAAIALGAALAFGLGPTVGVEGVAVGSLATKAIAAAVFAWTGRKYLTEFPWARLRGAVLPALIMTGCLAGIQRPGLWENILVGGIVFAVSFVGCNLREMRVLARRMRPRPS